jgi:hypothetical protein
VSNDPMIVNNERGKDLNACGDGLIACTLAVFAWPDRVKSRELSASVLHVSNTSESHISRMQIHSLAYKNIFSRDALVNFNILYIVSNESQPT